MPEEKVKMELTHEEWPGYKKVFYITISATVAYLAFVFIKSFI